MSALSKVRIDYNPRLFLIFSGETACAFRICNELEGWRSSDEKKEGSIGAHKVPIPINFSVVVALCGWMFL